MTILLIQLFLPIDPPVYVPPVPHITVTERKIVKVSDGRIRADKFKIVYVQ